VVDNYYIAHSSLKTPFEIFFGHGASATDACPSLLHCRLEGAAVDKSNQLA
jgi:hypothetical protein